MADTRTHVQATHKCRTHEMYFCDKHRNDCVHASCRIVPNHDAMFCSVCMGRIKPRNAPGRTDATVSETTSPPENGGEG